MPVTRLVGLPAEGARPSFGGSGGPGAEVRGAPVIVLALAHGGSIELGSLLSQHPDLACTQGTGVLPLCDQAIATWRNIEGRPEGLPSRLAAAATRALSTSIITSLLAREGKRRWCEIAAPNPEAAETFLGLYPGTRFLCLHRACRDVIRTTLDASPWGLTHPAFVPYTRAYPGSTAVALTACWVEHTRNMVMFERAHPQECLRVRFEDLTVAQPKIAEQIEAFLGLAGKATLGGDGPQQPTSLEARPEADLPVGLIPPNLLAQANDLLRELGYPALPSSSAG
jgi:hypothetical protein